MPHSEVVKSLTCRVGRAGQARLGLRKAMAPTFFACCLYLQGLTPEVIEHAQAGVAAAQQGRLGVAIQEFRKVAELQPNSPVAHARLGDAYFQNADYAAAIPELEAALRLDPNLNDTHQTLGVILLLQGNPEGALAHLEKLRTPELLGLAYLETGRLGPPISALHAAWNRQPNDLNLLYYFGRATALASKRSLDELAKVNPSLARKSVAAADKESRPPQDAPQDVVSLQSALAKRPYDADLLFAFSRATALASTRSFDRILQLDATSARAHQVLAERDLEGGRLPEAEREYVESLWQQSVNGPMRLRSIAWKRSFGLSAPTLFIVWARCFCNRGRRAARWMNFSKPTASGRIRRKFFWRWGRRRSRPTIPHARRHHGPNCSESISKAAWPPRPTRDCPRCIATTGDRKKPIASWRLTNN